MSAVPIPVRRAWRSPSGLPEARSMATPAAASSPAEVFCSQSSVFGP
ncbi:hypothetical protein [Streptomyces tritici]